MTVDIPLLKTIEFFSDFPDDILDKLCSIAHMENYRAGQVLIEQGQKQDAIYMIADGELSVTSRLANGNELFMKQMKQGDDTIGMSSLFGNTIAKFSVTCAQNSTLLTISAQDTLEICTGDYKTGERLMQLVVERFHQKAQKRTAQFLGSLCNYPEIHSAMS